MESTGEQGDFLHDIELGEHVFYIYRGRHIASDLLYCSESPETNGWRSMGRHRRGRDWMI